MHFGHFTSSRQIFLYHFTVRDQQSDTETTCCQNCFLGKTEPDFACPFIVTMRQCCPVTRDCFSI